MAGPRQGRGVRLPIDLDGPAPVWPRPVDAALEWWATAPTRVRVVARAACAVLLVLAATGGVVDGRWGPPREVLVAARALGPGLPVGPADVRVATRPRDLVPAGALTGPDLLPAHAVANGAVAAGTVLTSEHVVATVAVAVAGTAVVPVPAEALPPLPVGTRVDLAAATLDGRARTVARGATVVADDGTWRWLRVERSEASDVAAGVHGGSLAVAIVAGS